MNWPRQRVTFFLIGIALVILPIVYFRYFGFSLSPLNPHEHLVQNGLAYVSLLSFTFFNHTVFVPKWFLSKQYSKYFAIATFCIICAVYLPYRTEQFLYFKKPNQNTFSAWVKQILWQEMMFRHREKQENKYMSSAVFGEDSGHNTEEFCASESQDDSGAGLERADVYSSKKRSYSNRKRPPGSRRPAFGVDRPPRPNSASWVLQSKLVVFFLIGSVSSLVSIMLQATSRLQEFEKEKLEAELAHLKAQIQPHFLFNTLNSIYSLAIRKDARTADTIVSLSEFLRYIIRDAHRDKVPLAAEVNYIANYVELQRARLREAVKVDYQLEGLPDELVIVPLLLSSFIENAFKYGVNPEKESLISISLKITGNKLWLEVANNKVNVNKIEESTGIGLRNTKQRLELSYPGAYQLSIVDMSTTFKVALYIELA